MNRLDSRGQEEAPFELLVAAILMGFVLFVGMQAIIRLRDVQCEQNISASMQSFKTAIESVAKSQSTQTVFFNPECLNESKDKIALRTFSDPLLCSNVCSGSRNTCVVLRFIGENMTVQPVCVNIPPTTVFDVGGTCQSKEPEYSLQAFFSLESIPRGRYLLLSAFNPNSDFPYVCAYHKGVA